MGRYKWALIGTLIALALVVVVVGVRSTNQQADRAGAFLRMQSFCYGHVATDDDGCAAWSALVVNSGSNFAAVTECDRTYMIEQQNARRFVDCLERNGFSAPLK